jgi:threonine dehydrogenase-like Zn-dependent dehydrogenase
VNGVDFQDQHRREITIYGSTGALDSYAAAVDLVAAGRVRLASMVTHTIALEDAPRFFADGVIREAKDGYLKAVVILETA